MTRILIIEDEPILREEVIEWLTLEDYDALGAADGIAGIDAAFHHLPDLIICDITMPRLDGHGVLLELRANPVTIDIPFVFVTARAAYDDVRKGMDLGADDYITKPFTRLELLRAVQTRLEKKAVLDQKRQLEVQQWQQAWEQEREQRLLKSKLVAMFSHDFRNPLTSILSSNALLRDYADRLDENRRLAHFNRVETSVRQLLHMLDDMLVVAQMETGHLEFKPELLNIERFFQGIIDEFQAVHGETHTLIFKCESSGAIPADARLLRQIAANLISNAIKYSPPGSEVRVALDHLDGYVALSVQDQGIGIPEADQPRLFASFQRASNVGNVTGTGLGLAIVHQSAELHGGSVHLESQVNVGTTVTVKIPF